MKKTIVCFGDSNTWGFDAQSGGRFDEKTRWTGLLSERLGDQFRVVEEGLSGRTSVCEDPLFEGLQGISYIYPCLMSHSPLELVVIMLGTNDTKERFGLTSYNIAQGIVRLALKAKGSAVGVGGRTPEVLVVAPPPIRPEYISTDVGKSMGKMCDEKAMELSEHLQHLLANSGIHFADAKQQIMMNEVDYMHLDAEGHHKMSDFMWKKITDII